MAHSANSQGVTTIYGLCQLLLTFCQGFQLHCTPFNVPAERQVQIALNQFKEAFTTAPIIKHSDPSKPFVVEVDASEAGVGAILSQWFGDKPKRHPVAFFSWKLSPAEHNHDMGNRELLAVKLALEEWWHWLEGATHSFVIFTDHKNLEYLRTAKRLTHHQAGHYSSHVSRSPFLTGQVPRI